MTDLDQIMDDAERARHSDTPDEMLQLIASVQDEDQRVRADVVQMLGVSAWVQSANLLDALGGLAQDRSVHVRRAAGKAVADLAVDDPGCVRSVGRTLISDRDRVVRTWGSLTLLAGLNADDLELVSRQGDAMSRMRAWWRLRTRNGSVR